MTNNSQDQIPTEPENTGVRPEQEKSQSSQLPIVLPPESEGISEYPLTGAIKEFLEKGVRGQAGMLLLHASAERIENELCRARAELNLLRRQAEQWKEQYYKSQEQCSVLNEKIKGLKRFRVLQNIMITAGTLMSGVSFKYVDGQNAPLAVVGIGAGILLMLVGWFYKYPNGEEK